MNLSKKPPDFIESFGDPESPSVEHLLLKVLKGENAKNDQVKNVSESIKVALKEAIIRGLSLEDKVKLLRVLQDRFENSRFRHPRISWSRVKAKLDASPEKLWSLNEMERTGGEPDVVEFDKKIKKYIFMDCSKESPIGRRDCVYDPRAEVYLKNNFPTERLNGNALNMAALMGVEILTEADYRKQQAKEKFDIETASFVFDADSKTVFRCYRVGKKIGKQELFPTYHSISAGWRGLLKV